MKVLLITCPSYGVLHPPLSLAYLTAALRSRSHDVIPLDLSIQLFNELPKEERESYWGLNSSDLWADRGFIEKIISKEKIASWTEAILQEEPNFVGFSIYSTNLLTSLILAEKIKERDDRVKIIFGGPFMRRDNGVANSTISHAFVDAVVIGEGEVTLQELINSYEKKGAIEYCQGTMIRLDGRIVDCGIREPVSNLDSLPFPDFSDFEFNIYREKLIPLLSSRGCPYNCAFCNEKSFWHKYRWRSADNIIEEIRRLILKYNIDTFRFNDLLINGNLRILERFCDRIIQQKIKIKWGGYITIRKMDRELVTKLEMSGCYLIFVGIESGSQDILNRFKKGVEIGVGEELLQLLSEAGIATHTGWIVGFPNESFCDFKQTIDFIKRNKRYITRVAHANLLTIPHGSPMSENPNIFGIKRIIHEGEFIDNTTTLKIRQARVSYFNRHIAYT
jgi:radical SAM superfamily enzyme YgiQ (UPF0313 family)